MPAVVPLNSWLNPAALSALSREASFELDVARVRRATLAYARGLLAYLFYPPRFRPGSLLPTIAFFHGGGLAAGDPSAWFPAAAFFAERGYLVVSFQYRLGGAAGAAQSVADARTALRWLRADSLQLGVNPNAVVAAGDSAGGYLALLTALADNQPDEAYLEAPVTPAAIVAFYPIIDGTGVLPAALSPLALARLRSLPPTLIVEGTGDTTTPFAAAAALAGSSANVMLLPFPGRGHAFMGMGLNSDYLVGLLVMQQFVQGMGLAGAG